VGRLWVYVLAFCPARFLLCFLFTHWQRMVKERSVQDEWSKSSLSIKTRSIQHWHTSEPCTLKQQDTLQHKLV
jgi:hypothetical protein